jgi:HSP20 family molecular chaperone IbpA
MFKRDEYISSFGSVAKEDGVSVERSSSSVNVSFDIAGFTKDQVSLKVNEDGVIVVHASNGLIEKNYSIVVGDVELPERTVNINDRGVLHVSFAKAKKS